MTSTHSPLFRAPTLGPVGDTGLLALRMFAGLALAFGHGINKLPPSDGFVGMIGGFGVPLPEVAAWLSGIVETLGGLLLAVGLFTRPAALFIILNMSVALIFAHAGDPFARRELPLMFAFTALLFLLAGPGRYSIDARLARRPRRVY